MKEATKQLEKRCPVCAKEYPEEDNYCGGDGSMLEKVRSLDGKTPTSLERDVSDGRSRWTQESKGIQAVLNRL